MVKRMSALEAALILLMFGSSVISVITQSVCTPSLVGDGICQTECVTPEFLFDAGDCCNVTGCFKYMLGDGICQRQCDDVTCGFDGGDCLVFGVDNCGSADNSQAIAEECEQKQNFCERDSKGKCNIHVFGDNFCDFHCRQTSSCFNDKGIMNLYNFFEIFSGDCKLSVTWKYLRVLLITLGCLVITFLFVVFGSLLSAYGNGSRRMRAGSAPIIIDNEEYDPFESHELDYDDDDDEKSENDILFAGSGKTLPAARPFPKSKFFSRRVSANLQLAQKRRTSSNPKSRGESQDSKPMV